MRSKLFVALVLTSFPIAACAVPVDDDGDEPRADLSEELTKKCGTGRTVPGLDISYFQGSIDFKKVRASGIRWVIARTNDGTFVDPRFVSYFEQAKAAGLVVGSYMFYRAGLEHSRPGEQLAIMMEQLARAGYNPKTDLPPTVDVEGGSFDSTPGPKAAASELKKVLAAIEKKYGRKPIIYTNAAWEQHIKSKTFGSYPLWAAQYYNSGSSQSNCPHIAETGANTWTFWQHCKGESGAGRCQRAVPGVGGRPDQNVFNGTMTDLQKIVRGEKATTSTPSSGAFELAPSDGDAASEESSAIESLAPSESMVDESILDERALDREVAAPAPLDP